MPAATDLAAPIPATPVSTADTHSPFFDIGDFA
jgi:hypothetical protein